MDLVKGLNMESKPWYASKTLWFNAVTFVLAILALSEFKSLVPDTWTPYILLVNAIGNLVLRTFFTVGPIT